MRLKWHDLSNVTFYNVFFTCIRIQQSIYGFAGVMDVAEFVFIFLGLLSFVRASEISDSCESPVNIVERESQDFPYIGCYESACFKNTTSFTIPSINECTGACNNESSAFAALEFGDTCYCGGFDCMDQSDTKRCDHKCGIPCQEDLVHETFCGGSGFVQVYQATTTKATSTTSSTKRAMNTATKHRNITTEHTTTTVMTSERTRSSPQSAGRDSTTTAMVDITFTEPLVSIPIRLETQGSSVHIAIPVVIFLIIIVAVILTYHHLKHTGESFNIRVTERANGQHRDKNRRDESVHGATSLSLNAMPRSHRMPCTPGTSSSEENPLETLVGEVLYEDPDKIVSSATKPDSKLSHEYLVPSQSVLLENSSSDHDYKYPDIPDVGLVQDQVSARSTDEDGYIVMDHDPRGRTIAGSKVYYSSRIPRSQGGMGSSKIPSSLLNSLKQEERGRSIENPESNVYYSADSLNACDDNEDGAYIILDEN